MLLVLQSELRMLQESSFVGCQQSLSGCARVFGPASDKSAHAQEVSLSSTSGVSDAFESVILLKGWASIYTVHFRDLCLE